MNEEKQKTKSILAAILCLAFRCFIGSEIIKQKGTKFMDGFINAIKLAADNAGSVIWMMVTAVCVAIAVTGFLKTTAFVKADKNIRKVACFLSALALSCGVTALWFLIADFDWHNYIYAIVAIMPAEIVVYASYENTLVRNFVHFVAKKFLIAVIPVLAARLENGANTDMTKLRLIEATESVKKDTKTKLKSIADDGDLKNI